MSVHSYHPDTHTHGLADGCERCAEHAENPFLSLDQLNLLSLQERVAKGWPARSDNERRAMNEMSQHLGRQRVLQGFACDPDESGGAAA